jgi:hypothetical protein
VLILSGPILRRVEPTLVSVQVVLEKPCTVKPSLWDGLVTDDRADGLFEKETTGITFQYDQPDATAPQAILLVTPPDPTGQPVWNAEAFQKVLLETMDLVRLRAVGPEALGEFGHYLPALYFALNLEGDTVSTDFLKPTE